MPVQFLNMLLVPVQSKSLKISSGEKYSTDENERMSDSRFRCRCFGVLDKLTLMIPSPLYFCSLFFLQLVSEKSKSS